MFAGERFPIAAPEAYLFGDNVDLNFLPSKPVQVCRNISISFYIPNIISQFEKVP